MVITNSLASLPNAMLSAGETREGSGDSGGREDVVVAGRRVFCCGLGRSARGRVMI